MRNSIRRTAEICLKSVEKGKREWVNIMNEWLRRLIYGSGLNPLTLPQANIYIGEK